MWLLLTVLTLTPCVSACGSSADDQRLENEKLEQARKEGRDQAKMEAKLEAQEKKQKELEKQLAEATKKKKSGGRPASNGGSVAYATPSGGSSGGATSCGGGLSVGPHTTCAFARNVRDEYGSNGDGYQVIDVFSPVTNRYYQMTCTSGPSHVCRGGNDATVYF